MTFAASVKNATERACWSFMFEKAGAGLSEAACTGTSAAAASPKHTVRPLSVMTKEYRQRFICEVPQDFRCAISIGKLRMRLPVAAKIALVTAGVTQAQGASPNPAGASRLLTM